jgi:hypothetical protein
MEKIMNISNRTTRAMLRIIHLLAAGFVGTFIYSPWSEIDAFQTLVRWVAFPVLLGMTGLWMWQMPRINKWLKMRAGND